jgi:hypothetical protein
VAEAAAAAFDPASLSRAGGVAGERRPSDHRRLATARGRIGT